MYKYYNILIFSVRRLANNCSAVDFLHCLDHHFGKVGGSFFKLLSNMSRPPKPSHTPTRRARWRILIWKIFWRAWDQTKHPKGLCAHPFSGFRFAKRFKNLDENARPERRMPVGPVGPPSPMSWSPFCFFSYRLFGILMGPLQCLSTLFWRLWKMLKTVFLKMRFFCWSLHPYFFFCLPFSMFLYWGALVWLCQRASRFESHTTSLSLSLSVSLSLLSSHLWASAFL